MSIQNIEFNIYGEEEIVEQFQDFNVLIFLFYEKTMDPKEYTNTSTKKIYLRTNKSNATTSKRHNKSIKKRYKE